MKISNHRYFKGFTLVELIIVIAILGVIATALLMTINPGEAQKKTRDSQRIVHLKTIQTLINQFIDDGNIASGNITSVAGANSSLVVGQNNQLCGANSWLGIDTCLYGSTIPIDPNNGAQRTFITNASISPVVTTLITAEYRAIILGNDYEVNILQESLSNAQKIINDGGNSNQWIEAGTDLTLL